MRSFISGRVAFVACGLMSAHVFAQMSVSGIWNPAACGVIECEVRENSEYAAVNLRIRANVNINYYNANWSSFERKGVASADHNYLVPCAIEHFVSGSNPAVPTTGFASDQDGWSAAPGARTIEAFLDSTSPFPACPGGNGGPIIGSSIIAGYGRVFSGLQGQLSIEAVYDGQACAFKHLGSSRLLPIPATECVPSFAYGIGVNEVYGFAQGSIRGTCTPVTPEEPVIAEVDISFPAPEFCSTAGEDFINGPDGPLRPNVPDYVVTEIVVRRESNGAVLRRFYRFVDPRTGGTVVFSTSDSGNSTGYGSADAVLEEIPTTCAGGVQVQIFIRPLFPVPTPPNCTVASVDTNGDTIVDWRDRTLFGVYVEQAPPGAQQAVLNQYVAWNACWLQLGTCKADIAGPGQSATPDGETTADDLIAYIGRFFDGRAAADIAGPGQTLGPDGTLTADDIIVYVSWFYQGC